MNRLFGKSKPAAPAPSLTDIGANLEKRAESFDTKIKMLNAELFKLNDQRKKMKPGTRARQLLDERGKKLLTQRKQYEQQRENLLQQSFNLDQANFTTQMLIETKGTVDAMKAGVNQMKKEYKNLNINEIEDIQDDMEDMMADANEVQEALGRTYGVPDIDESELEAEFAALGEELQLENDTSFLDELTTPTALPSVEPATAPKAPVKEPTAVASSSSLKLSSDPAASVGGASTTDPIKEPW